jgi:hypothetical protein
VSIASYPCASFRKHVWRGVLIIFSEHARVTDDGLDALATHAHSLKSLSIKSLWIARGAGTPTSPAGSPGPGPASPGVGGSPLVFSEWGMG